MAPRRPQPNAYDRVPRRLDAPRRPDPPARGAAPGQAPSRPGLAIGDGNPRNNGLGPPGPPKRPAPPPPSAYAPGTAGAAGAYGGYYDPASDYGAPASHRKEFGFDATDAKRMRDAGLDGRDRRDQLGALRAEGADRAAIVDTRDALRDRRVTAKDVDLARRQANRTPYGGKDYRDTDLGRAAEREQPGGALTDYLATLRTPGGGTDYDRWLDEQQPQIMAGFQAASQRNPYLMPRDFLKGITGGDANYWTNRYQGQAQMRNPGAAVTEYGAKIGATGGNDFDLWFRGQAPQLMEEYEAARIRDPNLTMATYLQNKGGADVWQRKYEAETRLRNPGAAVTEYGQAIGATGGTDFDLWFRGQAPQLMEEYEAARIANPNLTMASYLQGKGGPDAWQRKYQVETERRNPAAALTRYQGGIGADGQQLFDQWFQRTQAPRLLQQFQAAQAADPTLSPTAWFGQRGDRGAWERQFQALAPEQRGEQPGYVSNQQRWV